MSEATRGGPTKDRFGSPPGAVRYVLQGVAQPAPGCSARSPIASRIAYRIWKALASLVVVSSDVLTPWYTPSRV